MTVALNAGVAKDEAIWVARYGNGLNDKTGELAVKLVSPASFKIPMISIKPMIGHPQGAPPGCRRILGMNDGFRRRRSITRTDPNATLITFPIAASLGGHRAMHLHRLRLEKLRLVIANGAAR
jgi:hypothetical protein